MDMKGVFELVSNELNENNCPNGCYVDFDIKNIVVDLLMIEYL